MDHSCAGRTFWVDNRNKTKLTSSWTFTNRSWTLTHRDAVFQSEWPPFSSPEWCLRSKCYLGDARWSTGSWGGCCCCSTRGAAGAKLPPDLVRTPALLGQQRSYQWCSRYWSGGQDTKCRRWHRAGCGTPNHSSSSSASLIWYGIYLAQENGDLGTHLTTRTCTWTSTLAHCPTCPQAYHTSAYHITSVIWNPQLLPLRENHKVN